MRAEPVQSVTRLKNQYTQTKTLEAHREKKLKRHLRKRMIGILIIGLSLMGLLSVQLIKSRQRAVELKQLAVESQENLDKVLAHQEDLEYYVNLLEDEEYVAKLARNEYYLYEDDELIFTFPHDTRPSFSYERGVEEAEEDEEAQHENSDTP